MFTYADLDYALTLYPPLRSPPPIIAGLIQIENEHVSASNRQAMEQTDITVRVLKAICPNKGNNVSSLKKAFLKLYDDQKMIKAKPGYDESLTKVLTHIHTTLSSRGALAHSDLGDKQKNKPRSCLLCCWPKSGQQLLDEDAERKNPTAGYSRHHP